jgi:hypothetical protein
MLQHLITAKNFIRYSIFGIILTLICACASVPPEAVDLSKTIGTEIGKSQAAHLSTLDAFYRRLALENDNWVQSVYIPRLTSMAIADLSTACKRAGDLSAGCSQLNNNDITKIISKVIEFRDDLQRVLSKNRDEAIQTINSHYSDLQAANSSITALLTSLIDIKKATKESAAGIGKSTGISIPTDKIELALNDFLIKAGQASLKVTDLDKSLSDIIKPTKKP